MSKRRILTAREQYDMLHPWRIAAPTQTNACAKCKGRGRANFGICNQCFGSGQEHESELGSPEDVLSMWSDARSSQDAMRRHDIEPWGNRLEKSLYKDFMDWWPTSEASRARSPEKVTTRWQDFPNEPITHWLNVEDYLGERHPGSETGSRYGIEEASPLLEAMAGGPVSDQWLKANGYQGTGNVITQAMLNLHNKLQGRFWANEDDKKRYFDLMLRHVGPGAKSARRFWASGEEHSTVADFFQWCAEERLKPNQTSLNLYAQVTGMNLEEYQDISALIDSLGMDEGSLEILKDASLPYHDRGKRYRSPAKTPTGPWYHYSPHDLPDGTVLIPRGGESPWESLYEEDPHISPRRDYVWMDRSQDEWDTDPDDFLYEVDPSEGPYPWNGTQNGGAGWVAPQATIKKRLRRDARRFWAMPAKDAYDPSPNQEQLSHQDMPLRENESGRWYHVSPHKMEPDTVLSPGGGKSPYPYGDDSERPNWVWMDGPDAVEKWYYGTLLGQIQNGEENPWAHIYEVEPSEGPHPWNGSGVDGHVAPSARIIREIETDKYNRLPDKLGLKYEQPQGITVSSHPFRKSKGLAAEVLEQNGPAILWKALKDRWPGDHHYVARGEDGTIHGVLKGHWGKEKFYVSDLYSGLKSPSGTGNHLLRTVAQDALGQGKGLRVINMLNDARPYWEAMGAQTEYNCAHADWSPEGLQALVSGDTISSPNTEGTMIHNQTIPRAERLPGSARQIAWGKRRNKSASSEEHTDSYHVTTKRALEGIKENGIIPQVGSRATTLGEDSPGIYLFPSRLDAHEALSNWLGEEFEDEPDSLYGLTVRTPTSWLEDSPAGYEKICRQPIPSHMITDIEDLG